MPHPVLGYALKMTKFSSEIKKTGFCLEHRATMSLRQRGWSVINNRYYVDDQSGTVREIDLVAYRTHKVNHLYVYTVLLVSCKKSENNAWVLLSRPAQLADPNLDRRPAHIWTNDGAIDWMLQETDWKKEYFDMLAEEGTPRSVLNSDQDVFAFQEMNTNNGKVQNDKPIFSSVTSLIKAQAYELGLLPSRKKDLSVYQFNLVSLLDGKPVRLDFAEEDEEILESNIDEELYFFDYIVNQCRTTAKIHFVREAFFDNALSAYERVHISNAKFINYLKKSFYQDVLTNIPKRDALQPVFDKRVRDRLITKLRSHGIIPKDYVKTEIYTVKSNEEIQVHVIIKEGPCFSIDDPVTRRIVEVALQDIYHFFGSFRIEVDDIPF